MELSCGKHKSCPTHRFLKYRQPVANGVVITGRTSFSETGPKSFAGGELVMLDAASGKMLSSMALDSSFHGGISVHDEYMFFGSGYKNAYYNTTGSFYAAKVAM